MKMNKPNALMMNIVIMNIRNLAKSKLIYAPKCGHHSESFSQHSLEVVVLLF